jgi:transketolase
MISIARNTSHKEATGASDKARLEELARQIRRDTIRMIVNAGSGHPGGALGIADVLAVLYGWAMVDSMRDLESPHRDRCVLSNGHVCAAQYSALARMGFIPLDELATFRKLGSRLQGHPSRAHLPGLVETSTGPLGQGFSVANGLALGLRASKSTARVYCIVGDGEMQEGQVWEAVMTSVQYKLANLTLFVSYNGLQIDGPLVRIKEQAALASCLKAFGMKVLEIDGHDVGAIMESVKAARAETARPTAVISRTVMGKGVAYMEGLAKWHGTCPSPEQGKEALDCLGSSATYADFTIQEKKS